MSGALVLIHWVNASIRLLAATVGIDGGEYVSVTIGWTVGYIYEIGRIGGKSHTVALGPPRNQRY